MINIINQKTKLLFLVTNIYFFLKKIYLEADDEQFKDEKAFLLKQIEQLA